MADTSIPVYRGKRLDNDEYIKSTTIANLDGLLKMLVNIEVLTWPWVKGKIYKAVWVEIAPSTLAIHFPDMIDSEDTKIFASLREDGKGGDTLKQIISSEHLDPCDWCIINGTLKYFEFEFYIKTKQYPLYKDFSTKITGIQD